MTSSFSPWSEQSVEQKPEYQAARTQKDFRQCVTFEISFSGKKQMLEQWHIGCILETTPLLQDKNSEWTEIRVPELFLVILMGGFQEKLEGSWIIKGRRGVEFCFSLCI